MMNLLFVGFTVAAILTGIYSGFVLELEPLKTAVLTILTILIGSFIFQTFKSRPDPLGVTPPPNLGDFIGSSMFYFGVAYGLTELLRWIFG